MSSNVLRFLIPAAVRERMVRQLNRFRSAFMGEPYKTVLPYTMVSLPRLRTLRTLAQQVDERGVGGDVVECGTCNGGSAAVLAQVASSSPLKRHVWLLDSFAGLPPAGPKDGKLSEGYTGLCCGSPVKVREVLAKVGVAEDRYTLVPGWFQDTLPHLTVQSIALLHIDADWYDSVLLCLNQLYDRVRPGGFVVLDDYGYWEGCRKAWEDFQEQRSLQISLTPIDGIGVYFQKPA
jgi:O-methyltransferase